MTEPSEEQLIAAVIGALGALGAAQTATAEARRGVAIAGADPTQVRLERTHASRVVIAGEHAFKFKRWVDLGFLDFRTVESRHRDCLEEVALNARLAPAIYLGVASLHRQHDGALSLAWPSCSDGAVDWCVVMRALPKERMLDRLLDRGEVDESVARDLEQLMVHLAAFHRTAPRSAEIAAHRTPQALRARLDETLQQLETACSSGVGRTMPASASGATTTAPSHAGAASTPPRALLAFLGVRARAMLEHALPVLEQRRRRGCVVDGHGDLHSQNICMIPGAPVAYDCLEFSQALRCRDTSAEIAFLAMDLDAHGRRDLADRVVHAYLEAARSDPATREREADFEGPQMWLRMSDALVRALVESLRAQVRRGGAPTPSACNRLLQLACGYALEPTAIIMCGLPGSGKSTIAREIAVPLRAEVLRSDSIRKELGNVPLTARGTPALYAPENTERVYRTMIERADTALRAGRHVVLDAAFPTRALRAMATHALAPPRPSAPGSAVGLHDAASWLVVESAVPDAELGRRLRERALDPTEVSDADERVMRAMAARFEPPDEIASSRRVRIEWRHGSGDDAASMVFTRLVRLASILSMP